MYFKMPVPKHDGLFLDVEIITSGDEADDIMIEVCCWALVDKDDKETMLDVVSFDDLATRFGIDEEAISEYALKHYFDEVYDDWFQGKVAQAESFFEGDR